MIQANLHICYKISKIKILQKILFKLSFINFLFEMPIIQITRNNKLEKGLSKGSNRKTSSGFGCSTMCCCRVKTNCLRLGRGPSREAPSVGVFLRDPKPYLREFRRKTTKNSERLSRQVRLGIEPGTSRQPVLSAELFSHWWGPKQ